MSKPAYSRYSIQHHGRHACCNTAASSAAAAAAAWHAGSDPTKLIEDLAKRKKIKTLGVSMGQGQEIIARKYMATAAAEGQWVLLQNTHLGLAYLTEVEQYLSKAEDLHEDFRWGYF